LRQLCHPDSYCISRFTAIQQRILDRPQLFLKAQRQRASEPLSTAIADLSLDLEMVVAISHRANRRLACATVELDRNQVRPPAADNQEGRRNRAQAQHQLLPGRCHRARDHPVTRHWPPARRRTLNVDSAIAVRDWRHFQYLTTALIVDVR
jgi:hypothetical protein